MGPEGDAGYQERKEGGAPGSGFRAAAMTRLRRRLADRFARWCYSGASWRPSETASFVMRIVDRQFILSSFKAARVSVRQDRARRPLRAYLYGFIAEVHAGNARRHQRAAARLVETGLAAGFGALACAGAESHPPAGLATLMASSGWGSGVKVWIASFAAASDWASSRLTISSRLRAESASPCAAARLNHLQDSARFCSTPMPRA